MTTYVSIGLFIASIMLFTHALSFWFKKSNGFIIYIAASLLYLFMAIFFFRDFILRIYVGILLIAAFFVFGCFKIYTGFSQVFINTGWIFTIITGVINLLISILGMYYFNFLSINTIVLALTLDILFTGISFVALTSSLG